MTTAADWISAAYNRSSNNDPGKLAGDDELLSHVNRVYQRLWSLLGRARPEMMASSASLVLGGVPPSVAIPAETVDLLRVSNALGATVNLIPAHEVLRTWHLGPCVYRIGSSLISRGQASDPIAGATLTVLLLDAPTSLTTPAIVIDTRFPVRHHQLAIDALAVYLGTKDSGRSEGDRAALVGDLKTGATAFAAEYSLPPSAVEWIHGDVERTGMS